MTSKITRRDEIETIKTSRAEIEKEVRRDTITKIVKREVITKIVREVVNGNS